MNKISRKIIALGLGISLFFSAGFSIVLYFTIDRVTENSIKALDQSLREDYDRMIMGQVDNALSMLDFVHKRSERGEITLDEAKKEGADILRALRYGKDGYFWADTTEGINVVLLGKKETEGKSRIDFKDVKGKEVVREMIATGRKDGGGYTDYWFPKAGSDEPLPKRSYAKEFKPFGWVIGTGNYVNDIDSFVAAKRADLNHSISIIRTVVAFVIVLSLIITVLLALFLGRRISAPLGSVASALEAIASGEADLTRTITVQTKDETAHIADSFNLFTEKLGSIISSIRNSMKKLSELGRELSENLVESASALNQIASNVDGMRQRIQSQAAGVTETTATMHEISTNIAKLNRSIERQADFLGNSSSAIEQMVSNVASVAANVDRISERFEQLTEQADTGKRTLASVNELIGDIENKSMTLSEANAVISGIAAQTNLLAMNAAIEAAHAGAAGKGFSVVADEIRKLAENSEAQSKQVAGNIQEIMRTIKSTVAASAEAGKAFDATREMIQEVDQLESSVKMSMVEQNEGSRQILEALSELKSITGEVRNGSEKMSAGATEILSELERLSNITEEINVGMNELTHGSNDINKAVTDISGLGAENKELIADVERELVRFKVRES
jgi:methyl-accepting chemotaxis protein